jgi:hypothetical protein
LGYAGAFPPFFDSSYLNSPFIRKVKLSYSLAGHGHDDGDADIGTASSHICNIPLPDFESLRSGIKEAFKTAFASTTEVFQIVGITDYDAMFGHEIQEMSQSITGIFQPIQYFST